MTWLEKESVPRLHNILQVWTMIYELMRIMTFQFELDVFMFHKHGYHVFQRLCYRGVTMSTFANYLHNAVIICIHTTFVLNNIAQWRTYNLLNYKYQFYTKYIRVQFTSVIKWCHTAFCVVTGSICSVSIYTISKTGIMIVSRISLFVYKTPKSNLEV